MQPKFRTTPVLIKMAQGENKATNMNVIMIGAVWNNWMLNRNIAATERRKRLEEEKAKRVRKWKNRAANFNLKCPAPFSLIYH